MCGVVFVPIATQTNHTSLLLLPVQLVNWTRAFSQIKFRYDTQAAAVLNACYL